MSTENISSIDGLTIDNTDANNANPCLITGRRLKWLGQTNNKVTSNVANQQVGTALLSSSSGTVVANSTNTVVVNNSLVTTNSIIFLTAANEVSAGTFGGDTTAGRGMDVWIESVTAGHFTVGYRPTANMAQDWSVNFLIIN
jgi:hypothetical protein